MNARSPVALLLLAVTFLLTGCGQDGDPSDAHPQEGRTMHVQAAGMVQSLGIT